MDSFSLPIRVRVERILSSPRIFVAMMSLIISADDASIFVMMSYAPNTPRVSFILLIDFSCENTLSFDPNSQFIKTYAVAMALAHRHVFAAVTL